MTALGDFLANHTRLGTADPSIAEMIAERLTETGWALSDADRGTVLNALEDASDYRQDQGDFCHDCGLLPAGEKCDDHASDDAAAGIYNELHDRIQQGRPA